MPDPAPLVLPAVVLLAVLASPAVAGPTNGTVELVGVNPNPATQGDAGEHLVLEFPGPTSVAGWTVADGETVARFPNRTLSGRVVATTEPGAVPAPRNATLVGLDGRLALANDGERVEVRSPAGTVTSVSYDDAPEGRLYGRTDDGWGWRVPGRTDRPVVTDRSVPAKLFVLPDAPSVPTAAIDAAEERVLVGAYTFTSERAARALCAARARGARVALLVEGDPVGGMPARQAGTLDGLEACGVEVTVLGGPGDRYAVHHPKYAVLDDRALVLSENWKPAGTGGRSSRGWGVLLSSPRVADSLAETFEADAGYRDARPWADVRDDVTFTPAPVANGTFPSRIPPETVEVDRVSLLVAPDNAGRGIVGLLDGAEHSVAVQQVSVGGLGGPFTNATIRAARRGARTRVLLSSAWYVEADNRRLVDRLNRLARSDGLPLRSRSVRPRSRFEKTHAKGLVVDGDAAVVGSLNWNAYAARENREVVVVLHDPAAAAYYGRAFRADWRGGTWRLPVGYGAGVVVATLASGLAVSRSVRFEEAPAEPAAWGGGQSTW